jgi:hypothetical protein
MNILLKLKALIQYRQEFVSGKQAYEAYKTVGTSKSDIIKEVMEWIL